MNVIDKIKERLGAIILKSEIVSYRRQTMFCNMADAVSVGIVFDSSNTSDFELVKKYVASLKDQKKRVKAIGYFSDNLVPPTTYSKLEYDFFTKKSLNWYAKPEMAFVNNFINDEYDVFIDLNIHDRFPLRYISAVSKAKFKVGLYSERDEAMYDMMIQLPKPDMKQLIEQADVYLKMVNKAS